MDPQRPPRSSSGRSPARPTNRPVGSVGHVRRRRRPTRKQFLARRLVVLVVVAAVIGGLVAVARSIIGDDTSDAANTTNPDLIEAAATSTGDAIVTVDPALEAGESTTSTTPAAVTDPGRTPTAADPARVLLVGDSEAGGLSPFLEKVLDPTGIVDMTVDYKSSTGLVRPDYYDWPTRLAGTVPAANPDVVVALFGGNDGQPFPNTNNRVDSPEWRAEYGKRVGELMDFLSADGRTLVWVGVPNALDPDLTANLAVQNEVVKGEAAKRPQVLFVDSWSKFVGIDGSFAPYVRDPRDGQFVPVRSETDGFHLNTVGEEILAVYVSDAIIADLRTRGAAI